MKLKILIFLLLWHFGLTFCHFCTGFSTVGDMVPDELNVAVNHSIVFNCSLNPAHNEFNSSHLYFVLTDSQGRQIELNRKYTKIIDEHTAQLRIDKVRPQHSGRYHCNARNNSNSTFVCISEARVGYDPNDLPVKNLTCIYEFISSITCSWIEPENRIQTDYRLLEMSQGVDEFSTECPSYERSRYGPENYTQCSWSGSNFKKSFSRNFYFLLKANNSINASTQSFVFPVWEIVRLPPPKELNFDLDSKKLSWKLEYEYNSKAYNGLTLQYKILIKENGNNHNERIIYVLHPQNQLQLNLKPFTSYNISISRKVHTQINKYWSKWRSVNVVTKQERPSSPPTIINQSFQTITTSVDFRDATIYWKSLPNHLKNGPNISYEIECLEKSENLIIDTGLTDYCNYTKRGLSNWKSYEFRIRSRNVAGSSVNHSTLILPPASEVLPVPGPITIVHNNSYEIQWENPEPYKVENFTLFWCNHNEHDLLSTLSPNNRACGDIMWKYVNRTDYILDIPHHNFFGVSANSRLSSSGILWENSFADVQRKDYRLKSFEVAKNGAKSMLIKWEYVTPSQKALISRMLTIRLCKTIQVEECKEFSPGKDETEYLLTELSPNTNYKISLLSPYLLKETLIHKTEPSIPSGPIDLNFNLLDDVHHIVQLKWHFNPEMVDHFKLNFLKSSHKKSVRDCPNYLCTHELTFDRHNETLHAFTKYPVDIYSCNIDEKCSNSSTLFLRTAPSVPKKMQVPKIDKLSPSKFRINFHPPLEPNGPIDFYYIFQDNKAPMSFDGNLHFADIEIDCSNSPQEVKVSVAASNVVNGSKLSSDRSEWVTLDTCRREYSSTYIVVPIFALCFIIVFIVACYMGKQIRRLKAKKMGFQINVQCNTRNQANFENYDENYEEFERANLVKPEENVAFIERRKVSSSDTNASLTSNSSIAENSNTSDKNDASSSSGNYCVNEAKKTAFTDANNRHDNREYYLSNVNDTFSPLLKSSNPTAVGDSKPSDLGIAASDLNKLSNNVSPSNSHYVQKPTTCVPLSPISNSDPLPQSDLKYNLQFNSNPNSTPISSSHYVSHSFIASQNLRNSTNV